MFLLHEHPNNTIINAIKAILMRIIKDFLPWSFKTWNLHQDKKYSQKESILQEKLDFA